MFESNSVTVKDHCHESQNIPPGLKHTSPPPGHCAFCQDKCKRVSTIHPNLDHLVYRVHIHMCTYMHVPHKCTHSNPNAHSHIPHAFTHVCSRHPCTHLHTPARMSQGQEWHLHWTQGRNTAHWTQIHQRGGPLGATWSLRARSSHLGTCVHTRPLHTRTDTAPRQSSRRMGPHAGTTTRCHGLCSPGLVLELISSLLYKDECVWLRGPGSRAQTHCALMEEGRQEALSLCTPSCEPWRPRTPGGSTP